MRRLPLTLALLIAAGACAGPGRRESLVRPEATSSMRGARRLALVVDASARSALGGVPHDSPELAEELRARALTLTREVLAGRGLEVVPAADEAGEPRQIALLFRRVAVAVMEGPMVPGGERPTAYGVGSVAAVLDAIQADRLLLAWVAVEDQDQLGLGDRQEVKVALGLVDRDGQLLWLGSRGVVRDDAHAGPGAMSAAVKTLLATIPGAR